MSKDLKTYIIDLIQKKIDDVKNRNDRDYQARTKDVKIDTGGYKDKIRNHDHDEMVYYNMCNEGYCEMDDALIAEVESRNESDRYAKPSEIALSFLGTVVCNFAFQEVDRVENNFLRGVAIATIVSGAGYYVSELAYRAKVRREEDKHRVWMSHKTVFREPVYKDREIVYSMYVQTISHDREITVDKVYLHVDIAEDKELQARGYTLDTIGQFLESYSKLGGTKDLTQKVLRFEDIDKVGFIPELKEDIPGKAVEVRERSKIEVKPKQIEVIRENFQDVIRHTEPKARETVPEEENEVICFTTIADIKNQAEETKRIRHEERHKDDVERDSHDNFYER